MTDDRGTSYRDPDDWRTRADCRSVDPALWHPETGHEQDSRKARRICHQCPVEGQCLNYALDQDIRYGIYGGMSKTDRRRLRREERREA